MKHLEKKWKIRIMLEKAYTEDAALWMTDRIESLVKVWRCDDLSPFRCYLMQRIVVDNVMLPHGDRGCEEAAARNACSGTARDRRTERKKQTLILPNSPVDRKLLVFVWVLAK